MKIGIRKLGAAIATFCLAFTLLGADCENSIPKTGDSTKSEMEATERNQTRLVKAQPPPELSQSLERANLIKRLARLNKDQNTTSFVYLISHGNVLAFYTIKGKVSSLNSLLTTPEQIVWTGWQGGHYESHVLPSPDFDGSYGKNPEGIFFFTTDDVYVEWVGEFLWSDQPIRLYQPVQKVEVTQAPAEKK